MYRRSFLFGLVALAACAPTPTPHPAIGSDAASAGVAERLASAVYDGQWRQGFQYRITFPADLSSGTAEVYVVDSDANRTEFRMPARVSVNGSDVKLLFTRLDRVDHLTFADDQLSGYTVFKGQRNSAAITATRTGF